MSPMKRFVRQLLECDEANLPPDLLDSLHKVATTASHEMLKVAGEFLHQLDDRKYTQRQVTAVIEAFPQSLSYKKGDMFPIQTAVSNGTDRSVSFIPQLAQEGNFRNVGGIGRRGGLLTSMNPKRPNSPNNINVMQHLAEMTLRKNSNEFDQKCLQVYVSLKKIGLMLKSDIQEYNLLTQASLISSRQRFAFLANWDPDALHSNYNWNKKVLIHAVVLWDSTFQPKKIFEMVLKAGMTHFPMHMGFLFLKDRSKTACEVAYDRFGAEVTMKIIHRCIPPSENHPILHHVAKHSPAIMNEFVRYYPDAVNLRDQDKRTLFFASLASGRKSFATDALFFQQATGEQIAEQDPVTELYPFALAATYHTSDLDAVFTLLRRDPGLVYIRGYKKKICNRKRIRTRDCTYSTKKDVS